MRYLFSMICVVVVWMTTIVIAGSTWLSTGDRTVLYFCMIFLTLAIYKIGFGKR